MNASYSFTTLANSPSCVNVSNITLLLRLIFSSDWVIRLMARLISSTCRHRVTFKAHHDNKFYIGEKSLHEGAAVRLVDELQLNIIIIRLVVVILQINVIRLYYILSHINCTLTHLN